MAAKRNDSRKAFPRGLYEPRPGYYTYRSPVSGRTMALDCVPLKEAVEYARVANRQASDALFEEKCGRVSQPHDQVDERGLLQESFITQRAMAFDKIVGVYFLLLDDRIVYIGKSENIMYRLASHRYEATKEFNRVFVYECASANLDRLESLYINKFQPIHNGNKLFVAQDQAVWTESIRSLLGLAIHSAK